MLMNSKYEDLGKIGEGSYGVVHKCRNLVTKEIVAKKWIYFGKKQEGVPSSVLREVSLLKELKHRNIVRLLEVIDAENSVELVFEYLEHDLRTLMDTYPQVLNDPYVIKSFLHQILSSVSFCHGHKILHRDLKPQNLLIDSENKILKLADFGLAKECSVPIRSHSDKVVTLGYRAPELLLGCNKYSYAIDVWSVGCIFAEMVTKKILFNSIWERDVLFEIFRIFGVPNEESWPGVSRLPGYTSHVLQLPNDAKMNLQDAVPGLNPAAFQLLSRMLTLNPTKRITAHDALHHEYFKDFLDAL